jgi:DNA-binding IclR family transcriptional regulator
MEPTRLRRWFDVLGYLAAAAEPRSVSEISRALDMPVSSAHDFLRSLLQTDMITMTGKRYQLGVGALRLSARILDGFSVRRVARPHLAALVERVQHDVYLAGRIGSEIVYLEKFPGHLPVNVDVRLGRPLYLHCTAVGKLYAAFAPELRESLRGTRLRKMTARTITDMAALDRELAAVRRQEASTSQEESFDGVIGLAVPIWVAKGELVGAIHISALRAQLPAARRRLVIRHMRRTALTIGEELGVAAGQRDAA